MTGITIDKLVAVHRKIDAKLAELQSEMDEIEVQRAEVRAQILELMKTLGLETARTEHGTVTKSIKERYWTSDWPALHQYIIDHGAVGLLQQRIHETNMREWVTAHPNDYPPSLNLDREYAITIRKPTTRKETV